MNAQKEITQTTITMLSRRSNLAVFDVTVNHNASRNTNRVWFQAFGASFSIETKDSIQFASFGGYCKKEVKAAIEKFVGQKIKGSGDINLGLSDESVAALMVIKADYIKQGEALQKVLIAQEAEMPRIYVVYDFLDWGDYRITQERRIEEMRLQDGEYVFHSVLTYLNDKRIGEHQDAWKALLVKENLVEGKNYHYKVTYEQVAPILEWRIAQDDKERIEQEEKDRIAAEKAAIAKQKADERAKNIENGAVYFVCESKPHDEDLTGVILNRPAPNGGLFTISHRIDKSLFSRIAAFGAYWDKD